jgi:hypothetical protein
MAVENNIQVSIISANNTRQGNVLRNTLKLAGYLFLAPKNPIIAKGWDEI